MALGKQTLSISEKKYQSEEYDKRKNQLKWEILFET